MSIETYEYKVVPAPRRGEKAKGVKGADGRFANKLEKVINELAAEAWEYIRTDTLPSEERKGLTKSVTIYQNLLIFRRKKLVPFTHPEPVITPAKESVERSEDDATVRSIFSSKGAAEHPQDA